MEKGLPIPKKILVTGASGYIGLHLTAALKREWPQAEIFGTFRVRPSKPVDGVNYVDADLTRPTDVLKILKYSDPDVLFHMAGKSFSNDWSDLIAAHVLSTAGLMDCLVKSNFRGRCVVMGSAAEYGSTSARRKLSEEDPVLPISPYGVTKSWQTDLTLHFAKVGIHACVARTFNVISNDCHKASVVGGFAEQINLIKGGLRPPVIETKGINTVRDFVDVNDVVGALILLGQFGDSGEIYNVCSGRETLIGDLLNEMLKISGVSAKVNIPNADLKGALDISVSVGSNEKIRAKCGWNPKISLTDSITAILKS